MMLTGNLDRLCDAYVSGEMAVEGAMRDVIRIGSKWPVCRPYPAGVEPDANSGPFLPEQNLVLAMPGKCREKTMSRTISMSSGLINI